MNIPPHMSDEAKAIIAFARKRGATGLEKLMLSGRAAMPSVEELNAQLDGNFFEQRGDGIVIHDPDYRTAG